MHTKSIWAAMRFSIRAYLCAGCEKDFMHCMTGRYIYTYISMHHMGYVYIFIYK